MSKDDNVVSLSGAPIVQHAEGEKAWEPPRGEECTKEISEHIEKHIGRIDSVFHELVSDTVHLDIHHVKPCAERPLHTLITAGMSDLAMPVPEEIETPRHMELMVTLPEYWQVDENSFENENWYWPIRQLKFIARFPHKFKTWLGWGHTLPNGNPAKAYAENTELNGCIILPSVNVPDAFYKLAINERKTIEFYSIVPLYEEEMNLKLAKGSEVLLERFNKYDINDVIDINRRNVVKRQHSFF